VPVGRTEIAIVEAFHLTCLRVLERRYDRAKYVVKGGVNIRAWFASRRYSEDMDIDAIGGTRHALEAAFDRILGGRDMEMLLAGQGIRIERTTKPKQTDTTQRWKFELGAEGSAAPLRTKIEFSWREQGDDAYRLEPIHQDVAKLYTVPRPSANHYVAGSAIRQKIRALAKRREPQARDVWDLDHLFRQPDSDPRPLGEELRALLPIAQERVFALDERAYRAQVVAFLAPEDQDFFGTADAWETIQLTVSSHLERLGR
jgi:Nucleotidyl transferase AbiEii toxin, Type IV TA system